MFDERDALKELRKESLDIYNRLHSIEQDIAFVNAVHEAYPGVPVLPNLRCGAWYTDPGIRFSSPNTTANGGDDSSSVKGAYFKSTDGHYNAWRFSLRRPNLHLLPIAAKDGGSGLILVDSTRAGKRLPDALSKTVPIWCAVVNRAVAIRLGSSVPSDWDTSLHTPPSIPQQEAAQISTQLDGWAQALASSSYSLPQLPRPLRPVWITPAQSTFPQPPETCIPIICVSASAVMSEGDARRVHGFAYVQGAGDDHELWGMGLTPELFWQHRELLLSAERAELSHLVQDLVSASSSTPERTNRGPTPITHADSRLLIGALLDLDYYDENIAYVLAGGPAPLHNPPIPRILHLPLSSSNKKAQSNSALPALLPRSTAFASAQLRAGKRVCFACDDGRDVSVGLALAALGVAFDAEGRLLPGDRSCGAVAMDKQALRTRLEWIIASRPEANPSRATLKRVNEFLMSSAYK
ncbi:Initiator tRNA phosphoribosyl transferase [Mycena chlorophos]|uniref:Initiator tRNA phosphoribosyl transferase n=1 Tax=Mycena chlorophos TaxID=658473 RepID=A0A8H6W197_MYCCL|nr:Initiator tRNA phosphoribosyl transferase [Mycena chlorophos]